MRKRTYVISFIIILLIVSQLALVRLIYAHKLNPDVAYNVSKIYSLKAGTVTNGETKLKIDLSHLLTHQLSLQHYIDKVGQNESEVPSVIDLAWERSVKDAWIDSLADKYELITSEEDTEEYLQEIILAGEDKDFATFSQENYGLSEDRFKELIVSPYLAEAQVYQYILENYNDQVGITQAQDAYEELEAGQDFFEVAQKFATDASYAENSIWLAENDLVDVYAPIKDLEVGQFGKIVIIPGAYVIWYLESIIEDEETKQNVWQAKSIVVQAKSFEAFFKDFLNLAKVERKY
ncbi:hypothetical protein HOD19_01535 [bacterium]|jgi:hypothetical protein|nr:hypothetical protein [bacterium]MBT4649048.1 hypothetical protein [bacterium]